MTAHRKEASRIKLALSSRPNVSTVSTLLVEKGAKTCEYEPQS